jgi:hypothetical protein
MKKMRMVKKIINGLGGSSKTPFKHHEEAFFLVS